MLKEMGNPSLSRAHDLLQLAEHQFGDLTDSERKFFCRTAIGAVADFSCAVEATADLTGAVKWPLERAIRARCVAWLCSDETASRLLTYHGIQVRGARIDEMLELAFVRFPFPLYFARCAFPEMINLIHAKMTALNLVGSHTGPISAFGLEVDGPVYLRGGFRAHGGVNLVNATIAGDLSCSNSLFISNKDIHKSKDCEDGFALSAEGASVKGDVFLNESFQAEGEVRLRGISISGSLVCNGGQFRKKDEGALLADGSSVKRGIFLKNGFRAEGQVRLNGATIGTDLNCDGGEFINEGGRALSADGLKVNGSVYLREAFLAVGRVSFCGSRVKGVFVWSGIRSPHLSSLDLRSAEINTLWDEQESWPGKGRLFLHGLVYAHIFEYAPKEAKTRIEWLHRQTEDQFLPQPYEQLATVLRKSGHEEDARKILIQKNKDRAKFGKLGWFESLGHFLLGITIGYGYRPWRSLWYALGIIMIGWLLFAMGFNADVMQSTSQNGQLNKPNSLVYSIDTFVPLVDLRQGDYWTPTSQLTGHLQIADKVTVAVSGSFLRIYLWIHIALGWIFTTLFAVALTGQVRR